MKRRLSKIVISYFLILIFAASCSPKQRLHSFKGIAMYMPYHIQVGGAFKKGKQEKIKQIIEESFALVDQIYNHWNPDSELSKINNLPAHTTIPISPKMFELLHVTDKVVHLSGNSFDPTLGRVIQLWKESLKEGTVPSEETLNFLKPRLGWKHVHFTENSFSKDFEEIYLDLDGIAKGMAVEIIVKNLNTAGFKNVYAEWAGEIKTTGVHPDGRKWIIMILNPIAADPKEQVIDKIALQDRAIATSGDYLQYWEINGKYYSHIIDKNNLHPMEIRKGSIASATVAANFCPFADGLATAALTKKNEEEVKEWIAAVKQSHPDVSFWIVTRS